MTSKYWQATSAQSRAVLRAATTGRQGASHERPLSAPPPKPISSYHTPCVHRPLSGHTDRARVVKAKRQVLLPPFPYRQEPLRQNKDGENIPFRHNGSVPPSDTRSGWPSSPSRAYPFRDRHEPPPPLVSTNRAVPHTPPPEKQAWSRATRYFFQTTPPHPHRPQHPRKGPKVNVDPCEPSIPDFREEIRY